MRGRFGKKTTTEDQWNDNSLMSYSTSTEDQLRAQPISAIKQMYEAEKASQKEYLDKYGNQYENIFAVNESFDYNLSATKGGVRNAVRLKDKLVVKGCSENRATRFNQVDYAVEYGEFLYQAGPLLLIYQPSVPGRGAFYDSYHTGERFCKSCS